MEKEMKLENTPTPFGRLRAKLCRRQSSTLPEF